MTKKTSKWRIRGLSIIDKISFNIGLAKPFIKDQFTGLPTLISTIPRIKKGLHKGEIAVIYIDIVGFTNIETSGGREVCNKILQRTADAIKGLDIQKLGGICMWGICSLGADDFLVFFEKAKTSPAFENEYARLKKYIEESINQANKDLEFGSDLTIHLGYSVLENRNDYPPESSIYEAVKKAANSAKNYKGIEELAHHNLMKQILNEKNLSIAFQPIVSLATGGIFGYEALTRGPANTYFESPDRLFSYAEKNVCLFELEGLCHKMAVINASKQLGDSYLFINVNPLTLKTANHRKGRTRALLHEYGIDFSKVVLELTERTAIQDYRSFREALNYYRNQGFLVAIDDAGAGYSSLQAIAELQPEFVKIDMSLIRNIDQDITKKAILETFVDFSYKINSRIICEGIETKDELKVLVDLGCDYGQGYYLRRPGEIDASINGAVREQIQLSSEERRLHHSSGGKSIGEISMCLLPIKPDLPVHLAVDIFKYKKSINGLVVCEDSVPVGLIMRDKLSTMLGTKYGYDLFMKRPVSEIMDKNPLVLPWLTPIEEAARQVAERHDKGLNDYVVITRDTSYHGVISVAKMIDTMANIQIAQAKDANPLTGLPGNKCITDRISSDLVQGKEFAVLYLDLDNFKSFNDYYGFEHGDRAIVLLAEIISQVAKEHGNKDDFAAHIGGDDFLVITTTEKHEIIARQIIALFDQKIINLYDMEVIKQGFIMASNRNGETCEIPIMTVSIAGVINQHYAFKSHLHLGEVAAEIKKAAKAQRGSCYYFDQRRYGSKTFEQI